MAERGACREAMFCGKRQPQPPRLPAAAAPRGAPGIHPRPRTARLGQHPRDPGCRSCPCLSHGAVISHRSAVASLGFSRGLCQTPHSAGLGGVLSPRAAPAPGPRRCARAQPCPRPTPEDGGLSAPAPALSREPLPPGPGAGAGGTALPGICPQRARRSGSPAQPSHAPAPARSARPRAPRSPPPALCNGRAPPLAGRAGPRGRRGGAAHAQCRRPVLLLLLSSRAGGGGCCGAARSLPPARRAQPGLPARVSGGAGPSRGGGGRWGVRGAGPAAARRSRPARGEGAARPGGEARSAPGLLGLRAGPLPSSAPSAGHVVGLAGYGRPQPRRGLLGRRPRSAPAAGPGLPRRAAAEGRARCSSGPGPWPPGRESPSSAGGCCRLEVTAEQLSVSSVGTRNSRLGFSLLIGKLPCVRR